MAYERFSLGRNRNLFGEENEPMVPQVPPPIGTQPTNAPMQRDNFLLRQGPLNPVQSPFGPNGPAQRPTFDPTIAQIGGEELPPNAPPNPMSRPSILDEYDRIIGNRPERDELKRLMGSAPTREQFKPNKMTRLGATLGGIAAGFRDPSKGVELAQSTLDRPFNEAQAEYDKKLRNVAGLAGMETEDVQQRLAGAREGEQLSRSDREFKQRQDEFTAEQKHRENALRAQGWHTYVDTKSGRLMAVHPDTNEQRDLGPSGLTAKELEDQKAREAKKEHEYKIGEIKEAGAQSQATAKVGADSRVEISKDRLAAQTSRLQGAASKTADEKVKRVYNALAAFGAENKILLNSFITQDAAGRPQVKADSEMWDDEVETSIKAQLRKLIEEGLKAPDVAPAAAAGTSTSSTTATPPGWSKVVKK